MDFDVAEIMGFDHPLSAADEYAVGLYLAAKYSLTTAYQPAQILNFGIAGYAGVINQTDKTIALTVPPLTDLATLAPLFDVT